MKYSDLKSLVFDGLVIKSIVPNRAVSGLSIKSMDVKNMTTGM